MSVPVELSKAPWQWTFSSSEPIRVKGSAVRSSFVRQSLFVKVDVRPRELACMAASYRAFCSGVNFASASGGNPRPPETATEEVLCQRPVLTFMGVIFTVDFTGGGA